MHTIHILGASIPVPEWLHLALDFLLSPRFVIPTGLHTLYAGLVCFCCRQPNNGRQPLVAAHRKCIQYLTHNPISIEVQAL